MRTILKLGGAVGLAAGAYALLFRPRMLRWGATRAEVRARSPGADVIPDGRRSSTMAVTLDAPPSAVWRWLLQMGYGRAGWYSWDRLDHYGIPSARELHPEWQSLFVGQRVPATRDGRYGFDVAALEPERHLALRAVMSGGRQLDPAAPRPRSYSDAVWSFRLEELPGARTRLVVAVDQVTRGQAWGALLGYLFWEPAHFVMQLRQFSNLRRRLEPRRPGRPTEIRARTLAEAPAEQPVA